MAWDVFIDWFTTLPKDDDDLTRTLRLINKTAAQKCLRCIQTVRLDVNDDDDHEHVIFEIATFHKSIAFAQSMNLKRLVIKLGSMVNRIMTMYVDHMVGCLDGIDSIQIFATPDALAEVIKNCCNSSALSTSVRNVTLTPVSGGTCWFENYVETFLTSTTSITLNLLTSFVNLQQLRVDAMEEGPQPCLDIVYAFSKLLRTSDRPKPIQRLRTLILTNNLYAMSSYGLMAMSQVVPMLERLELPWLCMRHMDFVPGCRLASLKELVLTRALASDMTYLAEHICAIIKTLRRIFPSLVHITYTINKLRSQTPLLEIVAMCEDDPGARVLLECLNVQVSVCDINELHDVARRFPTLTRLPVRCEWLSACPNKQKRYVVNEFRTANAANEQVIRLLDSSSLS
jgi:hypothetical protein